jgi:hypothetical protein
MQLSIFRQILHFISMLILVPNKPHTICFAGSAPLPTLSGHLGRLVETHVEDDGDCKLKALTPIRRPFCLHAARDVWQPKRFRVTRLSASLKEFKRAPEPHLEIADTRNLLRKYDFQSLGSRSHFSLLFFCS